MRLVYLPKTLSLLLLVCLVACKNAQDPSSVVEGKMVLTTLPGWEGSQDYFKIVDDVIIAGHETEAIPNNEFFCTEKVYHDFEIRVKAKLTGKGNNAGIQFRSTRIPDHHEVIGYQCDIGHTSSRPIWGSLYDESRRGKFLSESPAAEVEKVLDKDGYNDFVIRVQGPRVQIWLNDYQTVDYTEEQEGIEESGIICVQIHGGPQAEAFYKGLEIIEL